jgi:hypothetical protein
VLPAAIDFFTVLNDAAALILVRGADFLSVFDKPQRDALAMLFLRMHDQEMLAGEIFWGLMMEGAGQCSGDRRLAHHATDSIGRWPSQLRASTKDSTKKSATQDSPCLPREVVVYSSRIPI